MARPKTKKKPSPRRRRNAGALTVAAPRRRNATGGLSPVMRQTLAIMGGGAAGALVSGLAVRSGVNPQTASVGLLLGGGVAAFTLNGTGRWVAGGMAGAGAGQLALTWLAKQSEKKPAAAGDQPRQLASGGALLEEAFRHARNAVGLDAAFDEDEDVIEVAA